ncbi:T9SS type A sorting domain-containing protein [Tamlana crocina]|uniref:T9SS type A sorting domain-containing protein n=1 Tax=Tamlana crocina TaxID=393006 RepID=A0ABX1DDD3_9FLAO|nr:T9SS type A sorting domain-containing protein [Tamlana crocina]NJX14296.1 T9SS type A sorting domain-containing protein [Tamlana crocina]
MKKITLKISVFLLFFMFALQVQAQPCPELYQEAGVYKIATCGLTPELYMTINGTGQLEWAAEITSSPADVTQLWTIQGHREPSSGGYVEITADLSALGVGPYTMVVDQASFNGGTPADDQIRITARPGLPISDTGDANYGYDQFQRRKATGWSGAGNNALFAKPPGQGDLRYGLVPTAAGDDVIFWDGKEPRNAPLAINALRLIFVSTLSTTDFDTSSIFVSNPVNNELSVKGLAANINHLSVFSLLGKEVLSRDINSESVNIDVSSLTSGMYLVKLSSDKGSFTKKFVKQ